ncbi:MAG: hypothetical protein HYS15_00510 [Candidatus Spechtbacteria bacterium]|nr:hypothetical protein [Candidatus Spechtbacteria bacterium]
MEPRSPHRLNWRDWEKNTETPPRIRNKTSAKKRRVFNNWNRPVCNACASHDPSATKTRIPARIVLFSITGNAVNGKKNTGTRPKRR